MTELLLFQLLHIHTFVSLAFIRDQRLAVDPVDFEPITTARFASRTSTVSPGRIFPKALQCLIQEW